MSYFEKDKFAAFVGIKLIEVKPGYAIANMEIQDKHLNAVNIVQGGAIFTLADFAFAAASNSQGQLSLGINATISYFQPPKGRILTAEAKEVFLNKKIASYVVEVFDDNKNLVASFNGMVYRKKEQLEFD
jgi:acyl-CoA thioesterase